MDYIEQQAREKEYKMKGNLAFACKMASPAGRIARAVAGIVLIIIGLAMKSVTARDILVIVGLVPILAGVFNFCGISPLLGAPFSGRKALRMAQKA
jgi:predicted RND superfamily exporter protein